MVRQTAAVVTLELLGGVLLLAIAGAVLLAFMLAQGPVELNLFKADVERALVQARNGRDVDIERLSLQWSPSDRRMIIAAENLKLANNEGELSGEAGEAVITLDAGSLLFGRTEILKTDLRDGWADVANVAPNKWTFAGDPLPEFESRALPETPAAALGLANRALAQLFQGINMSRLSSPLEVASFERFDLRFRDSEGQLIGEMGDARGRYSQSDEGLQVSLSGSGGGLGLPGDVEASLSLPGTFDELNFNIQIDNWSVGDLAKRLGIIEGRLEGFPADIGVGLQYRPSNGIERISLKADAERGNVRLGTNKVQIDDLEFDVAYDPESDTVTINSLDFASAHASGKWTGSARGLTEDSGQVAFDLSSKETRLDFTPYFVDAWDVDAIDLEGDLDVPSGVMDVSSYDVTIAGTDLSGTAKIELVDAPKAGQLPMNLLVEGETSGDVSKETVLRFWPETLGADARIFARDKINDGTVTAASYKIDLKPDSVGRDRMRDEDIEVRFVVAGASVKFMDQLPPVSNASGSARLSGNGLFVQLNEGTYGEWQLSEGSVQFPKFKPKGELFRVYAKGGGPVVDAMRNVAKAMEEEGEVPFDPERFTGEATATFEMFRPALNDVPLEDLDINVTADITEATLADAIPGLDMTGGKASLTLEDNRLVVTGFGDLGPAPVQFTWRDQLDDDGAPADLSASAFISPDFLNRFGIVGRAYVSEDIPVELQAKVNASGVEALEVGFELQQSRIDVSEIGYIKPSGEPARATLSYDAMSESTASTFRYQSEEARFDGDIELALNGGLQSLTMREAFLEDFMDVSGDIRREGEASFVSDLNGAFLDVSAFFGDFGAIGDGAGGLSVPLQLNADLDRLRLREGLDLDDAELAFVSDKSGVRKVTADGQISGSGGKMSAVYTGPTREDAAEISLKSDDAGYFMRGILGQDFLSGGRLELNGSLARGEAPATLSLQLRDVQLKDAPVLTQILSLASLRGLADTLNGDGVLFSRIDVPITISGGRYIFDGARANGPALGLTMNGWFEAGSDELSLSGVLVPSFGMNSMLGGVPIIGDLFVSRDGEGLFSLTYSVRGTLDKAQVAVNPLSAVTPGILRRIFENPADTSIPDSLEVDPNKTPPAPPMPDAEFIPSAPGSGN
ncbi:YhdP family protein [Henriciella litoralis]|uniref:YhdP family protein n=1 Tax=Henriciella litoralis TaxID=568102 RepID=UPI000A052076|nr:AsmA-like C-terminal region-containing protein [Henriciella litoralis]